MYRRVSIGLLLWCATALLGAASAASLVMADDGRLGRSAIIFACGAMTLVICKVIRRGFQEMHATFERTLGKAYELGRRAERREVRATEPEGEPRRLTAVPTYSQN